MGNEDFKINLSTVNMLAIFGLTAITLVALVMKESNVASMAVGGIAGFIGHKIASGVQNQGAEEGQEASLSQVTVQCNDQESPKQTGPSAKDSDKETAEEAISINTETEEKLEEIGEEDVA